MSNKTLRNLYAEHKGKISDKWSLYLDEWEHLFSIYKNRNICLLEIGIQNGGSLEIWAKYFSKAEKIIGCDIDRKCEQLKFDDNRISVIIGDANDDDCVKRVLQHSPSFDIIIDDGSHKSSEIIRAFACYFPCIKYDGIYVVEDTHASYWKDFEGGLHNPLSAMAFLKRLADIVNYEHWRNDKSRNDLVKDYAKYFFVNFNDHDLAGIHSVEFLNSLCVIKKSTPEKNILGKRIIAGIDELLTSGYKAFNGSSIQDIIAKSDDTNLDVFELVESVKKQEEHIHALKQYIVERDRQISRLNQTTHDKDVYINNLKEQIARLNQDVSKRYTQIAGLIAELTHIFNSTSWRMTKPLRIIGNLVKKYLHMFVF